MVPLRVKSFILKWSACVRAQSFPSGLLSHLVSVASTSSCTMPTPHNAVQKYPGLLENWRQLSWNITELHIDNLMEKRLFSARRRGPCTTLTLYWRANEALFCPKGCTCTWFSIKHTSCLPQVNSPSPAARLILLKKLPQVKLKNWYDFRLQLNEPLTKGIALVKKLTLGIQIGLRKLINKISQLLILNTDKINDLNGQKESILMSRNSYFKQIRPRHYSNFNCKTEQDKEASVHSF